MNMITFHNLNIIYAYTSRKKMIEENIKRGNSYNTDKFYFNDDDIKKDDHGNVIFANNNKSKNKKDKSKNQKNESKTNKLKKKNKE